MSAHVVIGTAGHVDHGKTALVRALTGIDTDRWEEEKRRGITIDLGFAELDLGSGLTASVVDVPGHEDFVRNMVAGATGIDLALLVVAADEGVMPQTDEHLAILEFVGVRTGVVAIAKTDLVETEWLELVRSDLAERLANSAITWSDTVPVSAVTGDGLDALRAALAGAVAQTSPRSVDDCFRLPIDRVFTVSGTGTVVTGTTWSGTARVGDEVTIYPGAHRARVRGVEVHGHKRDAAEPGRRTALALAGLDRGTVGRGSWVVQQGGWRETDRLDAIVTLLPGSPVLTQRTRLRVHLGTAEVLARVTPAADRVAAGGGGPVRLRLEQPVVARWGDRCVLRSYSPVTTIGGAVVVDPWPAPRPRRPVLAERLAKGAEERLSAAVAASERHPVAVADLPVRLGLLPGEVAGLVERAATTGMVQVGGVLFSRDQVREARERYLAALGAFHQRDHLAPGMPREELRRQVRHPQLAAHVEALLEGESAVALDGATIRLATHTVELGPEFAAFGDAIRNALRAAGFEGCTGSELAETCGGSVQDAARLADFYVREGTAARVGRERYYDAEVLGQMVEIASEEVLRAGELGPAQLREKLGLTRKRLIPFLEWLDQQGYTARAGDVRRPGARLTSSSDGV